MLRRDLHETQSALSIFIQPHFDDVALSCGGLVAREAANGERPIVVTVFSSGPASITAFARDLHDRWGLGDEPWRARAVEDAAAMRVLGAESVHLDLHEAIYRGYSTWDAIVGAPHDQIDLGALAKPGRIYLPLGIGNHVDHQVVHATAPALRAAGAEVVFYEDFPYAATSGRLERRLAALPPLEVEILDVTPWLDQRIAAIACYASQLPHLFAQPFETVVRQHAAFVGGECFFRAV